MLSPTINQYIQNNRLASVYLLSSFFDHKGFMDIKILDVVVKIAACVCGKDGVISQSEEEAILATVISKYQDYSLERFNQTLDDFFDDTLQLEDYLNQVSDINLKKFTINLCEFSASADGLDIKENIALHKVKLILGEEL
jgi:hypothetical protein